MSATNVYDTLEKLGIHLPPPLPEPATLSLIRPLDAETLYLSGMGPSLIGQAEIHGRVLDGVSEEEAYNAARNVGLNALAVLDRHLGDLNRITGFVKLLSLVAGGPGFYNQHLVSNGASELLIQVFGEDIGKAARSAIGVYALPGNIPVEIEMIVKYK